MALYSKKDIEEAWKYYQNGVPGDPKNARLRARHVIEAAHMAAGAKHGVDEEWGFAKQDLNRQEFEMLAYKMQAAFIENGYDPASKKPWMKKFSFRLGKGDAAKEFSMNAFYPARDANGNPVELPRYVAPKPPDLGSVSSTSVPQPPPMRLEDILAQEKLSGAAKKQSIMDSIFGPKDPKYPWKPGAPPVQQSGGQGGSSLNALDAIQMGLDAAGVVEPTPFADLANAGISLGRAFLDPSKAGQHMVNAGISLVSMIPYIGDVAKLGKSYGGKAMNMGGKVGRGLGSGLNAAGAYLANRGGAVGTAVGNGLAGLGGFFGGGGGGGGGGGAPIAGGGPSQPNSGGTAIGNTLLGVFGAFTLYLSLLKKANDVLGNWVKNGEMLLDGQRNLARWTPEASAAMYLYDAARVQREIRQGESLSQSIAALAYTGTFAANRKQEYMLPYQKAANYAQSGLNVAAGLGYDALTHMDPFWGRIKAITDAMDAIMKGMSAPDPAKGMNPIDAYSKSMVEMQPAPPKLQANQGKKP